MRLLRLLKTIKRRSLWLMDFCTRKMEAVLTLQLELLSMESITTLRLRRNTKNIINNINIRSTITL